MDWNSEQIIVGGFMIEFVGWKPGQTVVLHTHPQAVK